MRVGRRRQSRRREGARERFRGRMMNIHWLQAFLAVKEHMSFSVAADALFKSQSALSKQIKSLEDELSIQLFDRKNRGFVLTPAGEALIPYAEIILRYYESMLNSLKLYDKQRKELIRITSFPGLHLYDLINTFTNYKNTAQNVQIQIAEMEMTQTVQALARFDTDFALLRPIFLHDPENYDIFPLVNDELMILCYKRHPFSAERDVPMLDVLRENLIIIKSGYNEYRRVIEELGIDPGAFRPSIISLSSFSVQNFIQQELGISIMAGGIAAKLAENTSLAVIPIRERPQFPLAVVARKEPMRPVCRHFLNYLMDVYLVRQASAASTGGLTRAEIN
jgi:DNA-binding transcriptional LysR family regulator